MGQVAMEFSPPCLIQRCRVKTKDEKSVVGFDSLFDYVYMGSAEFEFGSLGASLKEICAVADELEIRQEKKGKRPLFLVYPKNQKVTARNQLAFTFSEDRCRGRTQEGVYIERYLKGEDVVKNSRADDIQAWWCIDSGSPWIATTTKLAAELVIHAAKQVRDRWREQGKI